MYEREAFSNVSSGNHFHGKYLSSFSVRWCAVLIACVEKSVRTKNVHAHWCTHGHTNMKHTNLKCTHICTHGSFYLVHMQVANVECTLTKWPSLVKLLIVPFVAAILPIFLTEFVIPTDKYQLHSIQTYERIHTHTRHRRCTHTPPKRHRHLGVWRTANRRFLSFTVFRFMHFGFAFVVVVVVVAFFISLSPLQFISFAHLRQCRWFIRYRLSETLFSLNYNSSTVMAPKMMPPKKKINDACWNDDEDEKNMSHFLQTESHLFVCSLIFNSFGIEKKKTYTKRLLHSIQFGISCICLTYTSIQGTEQKKKKTKKKKQIPSPSILLPKLTNAYDPCICIGECVPQMRLPLYVHTRTAFVNVWKLYTQAKRTRLCICGEVKCNNDDW